MRNTLGDIEDILFFLAVIGAFFVFWSVAQRIAW